MSNREAGKEGSKTSEWKTMIIVAVVNLLAGIFGPTLAAWGIPIDTEMLTTAILGNAGLAASYAIGRSHIKAKALGQ
jgi:hypothetical protein